MTHHENGWDFEVKLGPVIDTVGKVADFVGRLLKHICYAPNHSSNHFVPFEEPNYWKAAEELHTTGAESDSIMETFE